MVRLKRGLAHGGASLRWSVAEEATSPPPCTWRALAAAAALALPLRPAVRTRLDACLTCALVSLAGAEGASVGRVVALALCCGSLLRASAINLDAPLSAFEVTTFSPWLNSTFTAVDGTPDVASLHLDYWLYEGLVQDTLGNLYVVDSNAWAVRKIAPDGSISTVVSLDNDPGSGSGLRGMAYDSLNDVIFIADYANSVIVRLDLASLTKTVVANMEGVCGLALDASGNLYASSSTATSTSDYVSGVGMVYTANPGWNINKFTTPHVLSNPTPFAGAIPQLGGYLNPNDGNADGVGTQATFTVPCALAIGGPPSAQTIFVSGSYGCVRSVDINTATVATVVGVCWGGLDGWSHVGTPDYDWVGNVGTHGSPNPSGYNLDYALDYAQFNANLADNDMEDGVGNLAGLGYLTGVTVVQ